MVATCNGVLLAFLEGNVRSFQKVFHVLPAEIHTVMLFSSSCIPGEHAGNEVFKVLCCLNNNNKDIILCDDSV